MLFLLVLLVHSSLGQNCSAGGCCYWYHEAPGNNSDCTVMEDESIHLICTIYSPRLNTSVKWFRSTELMNEEDITPVYVNTLTTATIPFSGSENILNGLYEDTYTLKITNFSHSDNGSYWCQIRNELGNVCLIPSAYVNITVGINKTCPTVQYERVSTCAESNDSSCYTTAIPSQQVISSPVSISATVTSSLNALVVNTPPSSQLNLCSGKPKIQNLAFVACLGVTVPAAGFVLILALVLICCTGVCLCWRKQTRKKAGGLNITEVEGVAQSTAPQSSAGNQGNTALPHKQLTHQYEDVELSIVQKAEKEVADHSLRALADNEIADTKLITVLEAGATKTVDTKVDWSNIHTYETIALTSENKLSSAVNLKQQSNTESLNSEYADICENKVSKQTQLLSSVNESTTDNQYSTLDHSLGSPLDHSQGFSLDHSLGSSLAQSAVVKAAVEDGDAEDHYYSKPLTHSTTSKSSAVEENEYQNLGRTRATRYHTLNHTQRQDSLAQEPLASDPEYRVLEEVGTTDIDTLSTGPEYETLFSDTGHKTDSVEVTRDKQSFESSGFTQQKLTEYQEPVTDLVKKEEGSEVIFDDPHYNTGQQRAVVDKGSFPFDDPQYNTGQQRAVVDKGSFPFDDPQYNTGQQRAVVDKGGFPFDDPQYNTGQQRAVVDKGGFPFDDPQYNTGQHRAVVDKGGFPFDDVTDVHEVSLGQNL